MPKNSILYVYIIHLCNYIHLYIYATILHDWLAARKLPKSSARSLHAKNSNAVNVIRDRSLHDCDLKAEPNYESMDYVTTWSHLYQNKYPLLSP